jgi:DNA-binding winged helix-turn-helix (wHTH) protein
MKLRFGCFELDPATRELRRDGEPVVLAAKPLALLLYLAEQRHRWVPKAELLDRVWPDVVVSDVALASALHDLREALGDDGRAQAFVATRKRLGYRFVASADESEAVRKSAARAAIGPAAFVGRAEVLAQIEATFDRARGGRGQLVLVVGEAGIGKTRIAEEFAATARARGVAVLSGWCSETGGAPAYWPWIQVLRGLVEPHGVVWLRRTLGERAPRIAQLLPELRDRLSGLESPPDHESPEEARFLLRDAVTSLLRDTSREQPLVVLLDDLHAADAASLGLLAFVAREIGRARLLVLGAYRDAEIGSHPLGEVLARAARSDDAVTIALEGLAREDVRTLVRALLGDDPPDDVIARIEEQSDGNPFLIRELAASLDRHGQGPAPVRTPAGVRTVVRERVQQVSPLCAEALEMAAVIGRDFDAELLARALRRTPQEVGAALVEARRAGLLTESQEAKPRYTHLLLRNAVYEQQDPAARAERHLTVATALEALRGGDPNARLAELAHHFAAASALGVADRAAHYAARAAERAASLYAFEEAANFYERALAMLDLVPDAATESRCELLLALGAVCEFTFEGERHRSAYERAFELAREQGDGVRMGRAAFGLTAWTRVGVVDAAGVRALELALAHPALEHDAATRLLIMARLAQLVLAAGDRARARALLDESIALAARVDDAGVLTRYQGIRAMVMTPLGASSEELLAVRRDGLRHAERVGDRARILGLQMTIAGNLLELGERAELERVVATLRAGGHTHPYIAFEVENQYGGLEALAQGRLADAERLIEEAGRRPRSSSLSLLARTQLYLLRWEQGRLEELAPAMLGEHAARGDPMFHAWRAHIAAELGRVEQARREIANVDLASAASESRFDVALLGVPLADALLRLDDGTAAGALLGRLGPRAHTNVMVGNLSATLGPVARAMGVLTTLLGRFDDAETWLAEAARRSAAMGWTVWETRAQLDWAQLLVARGAAGDREAAREKIATAIDTARALGLVGLSRRAYDMREALRTRAPALGMEASSRFGSARHGRADEDAG